MDENKLKAKLKFHANSKMPFFSGLIAKTPIVIDGAFYKQTGAYGGTDGYKIILAREAFNENQFKDILETYLHELMHIALMHPVRYSELISKSLPKEWQLMFNLIADARINHLLRKENLRENKTVVYPENLLKFIDKVGFKLKTKDKNTMDFVESIVKDDGTATDRAFSLAREYYEMETEPPPNGFPGGFDGNDLINPNVPPAQAKQYVQKLAQSIKDRMASTVVDMKMRGTDPSSLEQELMALYGKPKVNWSKIIKNAIAKNFRRRQDYNYPHKKMIASGFKFSLPALKKKPDKYHVAVAIDSSASMSKDDLEEIATEIIGLAVHYPVIMDVYVCDAAMQQRHYDVKKTEIPKILKKIRGRGGTSFRPVFDEMLKNKKKRKYSVLAYFTDGEGDQDELKPIKNLRVYWILNQKASFPFGKAMVIK